MDFSVFDKTKLDEYAKRAKEQWGQSDAYREFEQKTSDWTEEDRQGQLKEFMQLFAEFGAMKEYDPKDAKVQSQVRKLQTYITEHFYHCTNEILFSLGKMYADGGEFTENIDKVGGVGTADLAARAIEIYCQGVVL